MFFEFQGLFPILYILLCILLLEFNCSSCCFYCEIADAKKQQQQRRRVWSCKDLCIAFSKMAGRQAKHNAKWWNACCCKQLVLFTFTITQSGNIHFVFASIFLLCARLLVLLPKERCKVICGGVFALPFVFCSDPLRLFLSSFSLDLRFKGTLSSFPASSLQSSLVLVKERIFTGKNINAKNIYLLIICCWSQKYKIFEISDIFFSGWNPV